MRQPKPGDDWKQRGSVPVDLGMNILVITPHYPPLHAGTFDLRAHAVVTALEGRGRRVQVLTSNHGLAGEQADEQIVRRLRLAGAFDHSWPEGMRALEQLESHNHRVLGEVVRDFRPEAVLVWSLAGLSKSLAFALYRLPIPVVYGVSDEWLVPGLREDVWLRWWNTPETNLQRRLLEVGGRRGALDGVAPTRLAPGYDRMPELYGEVGMDDEGGGRRVVHGYRMDRVFFGSRHLRSAAVEAGFSVEDAPVIPSPVTAASGAAGREGVEGDGRPIRKILVVGPFGAGSGLETVVESLVALRGEGVGWELTAYGRGEAAYVASMSSLAARQRLGLRFLTPADVGRELALVMRRHDVFVWPREVAEGSAVAQAEAMACGLPVVGTRLGASGELLIPEETALTFQPGLVAELTQQLRRLAAEPGLRERLARAGRDRVMAVANEALVVDRIEGLIAEAAELRSLR